MSSNANSRSKSEVAQAVAQWATGELGFRKHSTLVTAKGEEKIEAADIEPLLQGELVRILDLASRRVVSSRRALYARQKLAAYCTQSTLVSESLALPYIALRRSLTQLETQEGALLTEVEGVEHENRAAIQSIDALEFKRNAAAARIRELRLQIVIKQAVAEKTRRMTERMKVLVQEMASSCTTTTHSTVSESTDLAWFDGKANGTHNCSAQPPPDVFGKLLTQLQTSCIASNGNEQIPHRPGHDGAYEQMQMMDLEDQHVQMWSTIKTLRARLVESKAELDCKLEMAAGQLNMSAASAGDNTHDFRSTILRLLIQDAATQVANQTSVLIPALETTEACSWVSDDHMEALSNLKTSIQQVRTLLFATRSAAEE
ncbi:hypothetical protein EV174_002914, partial [Coemansia sp. RSA 2320]